MISLFSTFLPYKYVVIPLLGVLIGSTKFACFPLLQYSMFFLFGIYFAKNGFKLHRNVFIGSILLTGLSLIYILVSHKMPNRFPPECLWIILPCAPITVYWLMLSKVKHVRFVEKYQMKIEIFGACMLDYLVLSNVLIFLAQNYFGRNFGFFQCLAMIVAIMICCCCYTCLKTKMTNKHIFDRGENS